MLFRPNTTCLLRRQVGDLDIYGRPSFALPATVPCAIISYGLEEQKSSVRADSSGTRGRAKFVAGRAKFLFPASVTMTYGDLVEKDGFSLRVIEVQPRHAVDGRVDHLEVDFERAEPVSGT